jgi:hypothetical protein
MTYRWADVAFDAVPGHVGGFLSALLLVGLAGCG